MANSGKGRPSKGPIPGAIGAAVTPLGRQNTLIEDIVAQITTADLMEIDTEVLVSDLDPTDVRNDADSSDRTDPTLSVATGASAATASAIGAVVSEAAQQAGFGASGNPNSAGNSGFGAGGNPNAGQGGTGNPNPGGNNPGTGNGTGAGNPNPGGKNPGNGNGNGAGNPNPGGNNPGNGNGDSSGNPNAGGSGNGDGSGGGDGGSDKPAPVPTPPDVPLLNADTVQFKSSYVFNVDDVTVGFDGTTLADRPESLDLSTQVVTKEGVTINPIDSEFGFYVDDFIGAQQKVWDGDFGEGFVGTLPGGDGIAVADARTDTFSTPARLGTWLEGIGGNFVKASTEHYSVMQDILADQAFPGDDTGFYQLDDDLQIVDYQIDANFQPILDPNGRLQQDVLHDFYIKEIVTALEQANADTPLSIDFDRDGTADAYSAYMDYRDFEGTSRYVAVVDIGNDGTVDVVDGNLNGFGVFGISDILAPNESTILADIAVGSDYSVTLKDDGKLLYRWGNAIKRPNDVRLDAKMDLPDEWKVDSDGDGLLQLYQITAAELVVNHTVTNNPNDQIRPEDFENEAAIGILPDYVEVRDPFDPDNVLWVSTKDVYAGDGTFLQSYLSDTPTSTVVFDLGGNPIGYLNTGPAGEPIGTVLRNFSLIDAADGSTLSQIGALSSDLTGGFTKAWYTTMDREPFQADLTDDGSEYEIGPRWRLQPDKYGQDLPSVTIPQDVSNPPPVTNGQEKYEVGADTTTVLNLLDWSGTSPLTLSAGWMSNSGEVSGNGVNMTDSFDVAYYIKGDMKPVNLYDAELLMEYEEVTINDANTTINGTIFENTLVGKGSNTFDLSGVALDQTDGRSDLIVLGYGAETAEDIGFNEVYDFGLEEDALGLIGFDLNPDNYNIHITQLQTGDGLLVNLDDTEIAMLYDVTGFLTADDFYFA